MKTRTLIPVRLSATPQVQGAQGSDAPPASIQFPSDQDHAPGFWLSNLTSGMTMHCWPLWAGCGLIAYSPESTLKEEQLHLFVQLTAASRPAPSLTFGKNLECSPAGNKGSLQSDLAHLSGSMPLQGHPCSLSPARQYSFPFLEVTAFPHLPSNT